MRPLSARGRTSAQVLAGQFSRLPIAAIYSSPSRRALETVEPLARRLEIQPTILPDLRERELTAPTAAEFEAAIAATWREPEQPYAGGESNVAAQRRGVAVVRQVVERHRDRHVMLATHGSLLALVLNGFDPTFGYDFWRTLTFPDVYELAFRDNAMPRIRRVWEPSR